MHRILFTVVLLFFLNQVIGQQPVFSIIGDNGAMEEVTIISGTPLLLSTNFEAVKGEDVYVDVNDRYVGPFDIGFDFVFYEKTYSSFHIGANGYLTFEELPYAPIRLAVDIPTPSGGTKTIANCILGPLKPWEYEKDDNVSFISIVRSGLSPSRKLIVTWCEIPPQVANTSEVVDDGSFQIVLNESDNIIENHLITIPFSNYGGNNATQGVMDENAFLATVVLNRNNSSWTATNESWRYIWSNSNYVVDSITYNPVPVAENIHWYELDAFGERTWISDNKQIVVNPKLNTRYLAEITACWGETIATAELRVVVEGVFPTAFNPNSTNPANREFKMPAVPGAIISNFRLQVYNRWGQIVFETTDANTGWNGRMQNRGQECPSGIYNWIMMVEDNGKSPISNSGMVVLIR